MQDTHDPFSFLLNEIRARHDAGLREHWDRDQRSHYLDLLLIEEAQENAWGRRHLTVVHGEPLDEVDAELLDELFAAWEDIAAIAEWSHVGGVPDQHLTLTIAGLNADALLLIAADVATRMDRPHWRITASAFAES